MAGVRRALIVATDQYSDPKLTRLNAPAEDARALAEVLRDPDVGAYEVETVLNKTCQEVEIAIARFFQAGARDDTLLVHFSCHGVKDLSGELYFATTDTNLQLLKVTGVSSSVVKDAMEESRASLILCLVDCCYSGAFTKSTKAAATVDLTERLGGRGRAVITASTSLQLALDGEEEPSLFTHAVVEGLQSGEADRDLDGLVTLDEFYNYIHEKVTEKNPDQTPVKSFDVQGEVYVARRGGPITTPAPLPKELADTLATGEDWQRLGAVSRLTDLLNAGHPGRALGARQALEKVRDHDDSNKVRTAATVALEAAGAHVDTMPEIPAYTEAVSTRSATVTADSGAAGVVDVASTAETATTGTATAGTVATEAGTTEAGATETTTGGGGSAAQPGKEVDPGRRWVIPAGAAVAVLVLIVAVWGIVKFTGDDGERNEPTGPADVLAASELLVVVTNDAGTRQLVALDVNSPDKAPRKITLDQVYLPTISNDRKRMFYLFKDGEPHRVQVDGLQDEATLLKLAGRAECPRSNRPSESADGRVALVCKDAFQNVLGLFVADRDGTNLIHVIQDSTPLQGPTWKGEDEIVYVSAWNGPAEPRVLMSVAAEAGALPEPIDGVSAGWLSDPDWSEPGVLFVRSQDKDKPGDVYLFNNEDSVDRLTTDARAQSPTWSPDGKRFAYLAPARQGSSRLSIWVQEATPGARAVEIPVDGTPGAPAWGPR